jgi:hypothetical protein
MADYEKLFPNPELAARYGALCRLPPFVAMAGVAGSGFICSPAIQNLLPNHRSAVGHLKATNPVLVEAIAGVGVCRSEPHGGAGGLGRSTDIHVARCE